MLDLVQEYNENSESNVWPAVFQRLRDTKKYIADTTCQESRKWRNKPLNRYRDVVPYDHSRIILSRGSHDYINANLVEMESAGRKYILTQGPLKSTIGHFWLMIWEQNSKAVLMLSNLVENYNLKCFLYWPNKIGPENAMILDTVGLSVELLNLQQFKFFYIRTFKLTDLISNESRTVLQFHYTTWPDFGVPTSPTDFLQFLKRVRDSGTLDSSVGPPVVHCSAGIGRSGTFCLVDSCLLLIEKDGIQNVDVLDVLLQMRSYRMGLIQTSDQLQFSYKAIIEGYNCKMEGFDTSQEEEIYSIPAEEEEGEEDESGNGFDNEDEEDDDEDTPPVLPPRGASLRTATVNSAPSRPLPAIPESQSLQEIESQGTVNNTQEKDIANDISGTHSHSQQPREEPEEDIETPDLPSMPADSGVRNRHKKQQALEDKVKSMKKRQEQCERRQRFKKSVFNCLAICFGALLGAAVGYSIIVFVRGEHP